MISEDCDFQEQLISERIPDVEQLITQRSIEPRPNPSCHSLKPIYTSFDVGKILLESQKQLAKNKNKNYSSILLRSVKFQQQKQSKLKQITEETQRNVMKECTFKPKVNKSFGDKKRTMKEFLKSQEEFVKKVGAKKDQIKKVLKQNIDSTMKTKLHKKNHSSGSEQVYDRLYKRSKQNITKIEQPKDSFAPLISARSKNMARELPISEHLYTDALRRKEDQTTRESMKSAYVSETPRTLSMKTQKYAGQKFIKQFYYTIHQLNIQEPLEYESFILLLQRLGFITISLEQAMSQSDNKQVVIVQQAYYKVSEVDLSLRNICVLLLALLGIHYVNPVESTDVPLLNLSLQESKKIKQQFDLLYRNRLSMEQLRKTLPTQQPLFQPVINGKSQVLAEIRRHKILQETSALLQKNEYEIDVNSFNHVDLLHLNKINKQIQIMKRREQNRQKDMKECTFHPQTTCRTEQEDIQAGIRKCDQLYQLSKQLPERQIRTVEEVQFQKNKQQCTFKPKINKDRKVFMTEPAKNFEKTIVRMQEARKIQQQKSNKLKMPSQRASKSNSNNNSNHVSICEMEEQPFLVIDINIGDSIEQLVIYKKDLGKEVSLAKQFAYKHKIDEAGEERLAHLLKQQVNSIMNKIEQQEEEYEASTLL